MRSEATAPATFFPNPPRDDLLYWSRQEVITMPRTAGLVSIIIPTINRSGLLEETLASAIKQQHRPLEIIIVNDGSTDNTADLLQEWQGKHPDIIRPIHKENGGVCSARNMGMKESRGEFIQFLDDDDLLDSEKISRQVESLRGDPDLDFVVGDWAGFTTADQLGTVTPKWQEGEEVSLGGFLTGRDFTPFMPLFRASSLHGHGIWDETIICGEDLEYFGRLMALGLRRAYHGGAVGYYRLYENNTRWQIEELKWMRSRVRAFDEIEAVARGAEKSVPVDLRRMRGWCRYRQGILTNDKKATLFGLDEAMKKAADFKSYFRAFLLASMVRLLGCRLTEKITSR